MLNPNLEKVPQSCWRKLESLLSAVAPPKTLNPIRLHIGDPEHPIADFVIQKINETKDEFIHYSPITGTPALRDSMVGWLNRRYGLPQGMLDSNEHVIPAAGLREAMFLIGVVVIPEEKNGRRPLVAIPDPFYHAYVGAATSLGADPLLMPARRETGFLPDLDTLDDETLNRLAAFYLCTPANPQGVAVNHEYAARLIRMAREHDFVLLVDECYGDIYTGVPPHGVLESCARMGGDMSNVLVFHSLSKRSNVPGLRSGFVAGDPELLRAFKLVRDSGGVAMPLPVQAASTALWSDDAHAEVSRRLYIPKFEAAERILGNRCAHYRPDGGMFLWLNVGDCEAVTSALWGEQGVRVLPGKYMSMRSAEGDYPGAGYIRVALVPDLDTTVEALERMARVL